MEESIEEVVRLAIRFAAMEPKHYEAALDLWRRSEGIVLRCADERDALERYLERNPGLSQIALEDGRLVGAVLCGHDGRRGYLYHLAVAKNRRLCGIGSELVNRCLKQLERQGIEKAHIDVVSENSNAEAFWSKLGWYKRGDLIRYSSELLTPPRADAPVQCEEDGYSTEASD